MPATPASNLADRTSAAETDELLTPYFWVSGGDHESFETAAGDDPSIRDLTRLDTFEEAALYRAEWTENVESIVYAYTQVGAVVFEATGSGNRWELRMRFDSRERLQQFNDYLEDEGIDFELARIHEVTSPRTASQYGLTSKQQEALITAWDAGYFETPRQTSLDDVADQLDISQQAVSSRPRR